MATRDLNPAKCWTGCGQVPGWLVESVIQAERRKSKPMLAGNARNHVRALREDL